MRYGASAVEPDVFVVTHGKKAAIEGVSTRAAGVASDVEVAVRAHLIGASGLCDETGAGIADVLVAAYGQCSCVDGKGTGLAGAVAEAEIQCGSVASRDLDGATVVDVGGDVAVWQAGGPVSRGGPVAGGGLPCGVGGCFFGDHRGRDAKG